MKKFTIENNECLEKDTLAFYHTEYYGFKDSRTPTYVNHLKNQFGNSPRELLQCSYNELCDALLTDFTQLKTQLPEDCVVCAVPRAKAEKEYTPNQLLFKKAVSCVARQTFIDGTQYINRLHNTATTHLKNYDGYNRPNERMPYRGITNDTCVISNEVRGKTILLVDDIYTKSVNIDEDCIQALYDKGAQRVVFYAIGKTTHDMVSPNIPTPPKEQLSDDPNIRLKLDIFKSLTSKDFDPTSEADVEFYNILFPEIG